MVELHAVISGIRGHLGSGLKIWNEDMTELATAYASLCREANERLSRCRDYLAQGLISEALHLADCQPRLVKFVESLSLPDPARWADLCLTNGAECPPPLESDVLPLLHQAREREKRLRPLLSRHRLLVLAGARAADRLRVVRLLARHDPGNRCWREESDRLLPLRAEEIAAEFHALSAAGDADALQRLAMEAGDADLSVLLPPDVSDSLAESSSAAARARLLAEANKLAEKVQTTSPSKFDTPEEKTSTINRWREIREVLNGSLPDDLRAADSVVEEWERAERARNESEESARLRKVFLSSATERTTTTTAPNRKSRRRLIFVGLPIFTVILLAAYFSVNPERLGKLEKLYHDAKRAFSP